MTDIEARDALAAALSVTDPRTYCHHTADAILAALDGWTLVPAAHLREVEQENERLERELQRCEEGHLA